MMLKLGQQVTVQELLYGMMVHSGRDAAVALADLVGGNSDHFVVMMNNKVERHDEQSFRDAERTADAQRTCNGRRHGASRAHRRK